MRNALLNLLCFGFIASILLSSVKAQTPPTTSSAISWKTAYASLEADEMTITVNGKVYHGVNVQNLVVHSDGASQPNDNTITLEVSWDEPGVGKMSVYIYFIASPTQWWVYDLRTTGDGIIDDWTYYLDSSDITKNFVKPLGTAYTSSLFTLASIEKNFPSTTIQFKNLRLLPSFSNLTNPPEDDIYFITTGVNQTQLLFSDPSDSSESTTPIDPEALIPGKQYQVTADIRTQNTVKTTVDDQTPVYFQLQGMGATAETTLPYSLIRNNSGGASTTLTTTFTAGTINRFALYISNRGGSPYETEYRNNQLVFTYPQSSCEFVNNTIIVGNGFSNSRCTDLQQAIDAIPNRTDIYANPMYTIKINQGSYNLFNSTTTPGLVIKNKGRVLIQSTNQTEDVKLYFPASTQGVVIDNSHVDMEYIRMYGASYLNGSLVDIKNNSYFKFGKGSMYSDTSPLLRGVGSTEVSVYNSDLTSTKLIATITDSELSNFSNNTINGLDQGQGLIFYNTNAAVQYNLITNTSEGAVIWNGQDTGMMTGNTLTNNKSAGSRGLIYYQKGTKPVQIDKNIVAFNTGYDIFVNESADLLTVSNNLFHANGFDGGNIRFFNMPNPTGSNGNVDADPLFGSEYCLTKNSPAMMAYPDVFMGHRGACLPLEEITPTPTQSFITNPPSWWFMIPTPLRNFLEQLYVWVFLFRQPTSMINLLQGIPTPLPVTAPVNQ